MATTSTNMSTGGKAIIFKSKKNQIKYGQPRITSVIIEPTGILVTYNTQKWEEFSLPVAMRRDKQQVTLIYTDDSFGILSFYNVSDAKLFVGTWNQIPEWTNVKEIVPEKFNFKDYTVALFKQMTLFGKRK